MSDLRIKYTKFFIKQAFVDMLKSLPIRKITVKAICEKAEINRSTFYKYYKDVYDLFDQLENEYLEVCVGLAAGSDNSLKVTLKDIAETFKADCNSITAIFDETTNPAGKRKLCDKCYEFCTSGFSGGGGVDAHIPPVFPEKYRFEFFFYGCFSTLFRWYENGMTTPVSEIVEVMYDFTPPLLKAYC